MKEAPEMRKMVAIIRKLLIIPIIGLLFASLVQPYPSWAQQAPRVVILSPAGALDNRTTVPTSFLLSFYVTNLEIVQPGLPGQTNRPTQGHLHVFLDGRYHTIWASPNPVPFNDIPPGEHTINIELMNNDHSRVSPRVNQTIKVTVRAQAPISDLARVRNDVSFNTTLLYVLLGISVVSIVMMIAAVARRRG